MTRLLDLPSTRQEEWRWSDLSALPALAGAKHGDAPVGDVAEVWLGGGGPRLLFVDGVLDPARSDPQGIVLGRTATASSHPLGRLAGQDGWSLRLRAEHAAAGPVEIVHLATGGASHLAGEVLLEEDAQASIVETFLGSGWANRAIAIRLGRSARLMLARRLAQEGGFTSLADGASVAAGASLVATTLAEGDGDSRLDFRASLDGKGAYVEVGGALLARADQRHDANLVLRHAAPGGQSRQTWRAVAAERAVASLAARVEVARDAQQTDADQSLRGLLLDRTATVNLKPELEIFADDVKCAHGATVGELDAQALFYLASRGIAPAPARALLTRAFVADALARIGEDKLRDAFQTAADRWLGGEA